MSNKVTVKLDMAGLKAFRQSSEMLKLMEETAQARTGPHHHVKSFVGFDRAKAIIYPNTKRYPG